MRERAILVDWDLYRTNKHTQDFVKARQGQARLILLVSHPAENDYEYGERPDDIEWDAVIRNTGTQGVVKFKYKALDIITSVSNLDPVIGLDASTAVNDLYRDSGVLITTEDL